MKKINLNGNYVNFLKNEFKDDYYEIPGNGGISSGGDSISGDTTTDNTISNCEHQYKTKHTYWYELECLEITYCVKCGYEDYVDSHPHYYENGYCTYCGYDGSRNTIYDENLGS